MKSVGRVSIRHNKVYSQKHEVYNQWQLILVWKDTFSYSFAQFLLKTTVLKIEIVTMLDINTVCGYTQKTPLSEQSNLSDPLRGLLKCALLTSHT